MSLGRMYTLDFAQSGLPVALAGPTTVAGITTSAVNPIDIQAIRFGVMGAASFPSNASVQLTMARASAGYTSGGHLTLAANPHNTTDVAANTTLTYNCSTATGGGAGTFSAIVGFTQGVTLWSQEIPFTAGSNWAEWVTPGAEWRVPISSFLGFYMTQSSAGTATLFGLEIVFAE
jgi:hypothetical protein